MSVAPGPLVTIVVARARNGVIGKANGLPWRLPEDLAHFRRTTLGRAVLMGRRTFESIGKPLPGRRTIVITRDPGWAHPGCERAGSIAEALALAATPALGETSYMTDEAIVAGGAQIYREAMPLAGRIVLTEVDADVDGDTFLDAPDPLSWEETRRESHTSGTGLAYSIVEYRRRAPRETPDTANT